MVSYKFRSWEAPGYGLLRSCSGKELMLASAELKNAFYTQRALQIFSSIAYSVVTLERDLFTVSNGEEKQ